MTIDLNTGKFVYNNFHFYPQMRIDKIKSYFAQSQLELRLKNDKWETYKTTIEHYIFRFIVFDGAIKIVEIFPVGNGGETLEDTLSVLGGERVYHWGQVELNNDLKAGYKSVLIKYN